MSHRAPPKLSTPNKGYFIIADISGYTRLMAQAQLEQSKTVVGGLMAVLLAQIRPPLLVARLEGDAVFCFAPEGSFLQGQTLLEMIEKLYCGFRQALEVENNNAACDCEACTLRPSLDLKIIVHYGPYAVERVGGTQELHGRDVIIAHRLLKNHVREQTGLPAYALVTEAAAAAMRLGALTESMRPHTETYEHLGQVRGYVYDLAAVWERDRAGRQVPVDPGDKLWFTAEIDLPVPPPLAWDYLHAPEKKRQWLHLQALAVSGQHQGRVGPGTVHHCVLGRQAWQHYFVNWQPFDHATAEYPLPWGGVGRLTLSLAPIAGGTRVSVRAACPRGERVSKLYLLVLGGRLRRRLESTWRQGLQLLRDLVVADLNRPDQTTPAGNWSAADWPASVAGPAAA